MELLLEAGVDPNSMSFDQTTPLHIASRQGDEKMVKLLLSHGADPAIATVPVALISYKRKTPWEITLHESVALLILEHPRSVINKQNLYTKILLRTAASKGNIKVCQKMIDAGVPVLVGHHYGITPLWLATKGGHFEVAELLGAAEAKERESLEKALAMISTVVSDEKKEKKPSSTTPEERSTLHDRNIWVSRKTFAIAILIAILAIFIALWHTLTPFLRTFFGR